MYWSGVTTLTPLTLTTGSCRNAKDKGGQGTGEGRRDGGTDTQKERAVKIEGKQGEKREGGRHRHKVAHGHDSHSEKRKKTKKRKDRKKRKSAATPKQQKSKILSTLDTHNRKYGANLLLHLRTSASMSSGQNKNHSKVSIEHQTGIVPPTSNPLPTNEKVALSHDKSLPIILKFLPRLNDLVLSIVRLQHALSWPDGLQELAYLAQH